MTFAPARPSGCDLLPRPHLTAPHVQGRRVAALQPATVVRARARPAIGLAALGRPRPRVAVAGLAALAGPRRPAAAGLAALAGPAGGVVVVVVPRLGRLAAVGGAGRGAHG